MSHSNTKQTNTSFIIIQYDYRRGISLLCMLLSYHYTLVRMRKRGICGIVFVCVDYYSCSRINEVQVRVSIGF